MNSCHISQIGGSHTKRLWWSAVSLALLLTSTPSLAQDIQPGSVVPKPPQQDPLEETPASDAAKSSETSVEVEVDTAPPGEAAISTDGIEAAGTVDEVPAKTPVSGPTGRIWTVDELIEKAYANAAAMRVEEAKQRHAEWQAFRADYAWTPKIQATTLLAPVPANTDPNDLTNNLDEIAALNIGPFIRQTASLILPLYSFGRIRTAREIARVGKKNSELEEQKARRELEYQVRQAYYGLRIARTLSTMIEEGQKLVSEQLLKMEDARDFGDADFNIKDFRKLQIFQADLEGRALDNQKIITLATAGIRYLTGEEVGIENVYDLDTESEPANLGDFSYYYSVAEKHRPEIKQLEQAIEARRLQVSLERKSFYPNIFFGANFTFGYSNKNIANQRVFRTENGELVDTDLVAAPFSNPYDQLGFGISLGMRWDLDIAQSYGQLQEAKALEDKTLAQRSQALGAIELEIKKLHLEAEQARERIAIQGRRLEAARRWRDQLGLSIESAGADVSDALEPLKAYYEAKVLHMQAVLEYEMARAALAKGLGVVELSTP